MELPEPKPDAVSLEGIDVDAVLGVVGFVGVLGGHS
jgi:hypothetical protein